MAVFTGNEHCGPNFFHSTLRASTSCLLKPKPQPSIRTLPGSPRNPRDGSASCHSMPAQPVTFLASCAFQLPRSSPIPQFPVWAYPFLSKQYVTSVFAEAKERLSLAMSPFVLTCMENLRENMAIQRSIGRHNTEDGPSRTRPWSSLPASFPQTPDL